MKTRSVIAGILLLIALLPLAACGGTDSLADTSWKLASYNSPSGYQEALAGTDVTLNFDNESGLGGSAGCNSYGGDYKVSGKSGVEIDDVFRTLMYCMEEGVMDQEDSFIQGLGEVDSYTVEGDKLTMTGGGWTLTFVKNYG